MNAEYEAPTESDAEAADAIVFGTPTRFGNVSSELKAFVDSLGGLWFQGKLVGKGGRRVLLHWQSAWRQREHEPDHVQLHGAFGLDHRPAGVRRPDHVPGGNALRGDLDLRSERCAADGERPASGPLSRTPYRAGRQGFEGRQVRRAEVNLVPRFSLRGASLKGSMMLSFQHRFAPLWAAGALAACGSVVQAAPAGTDHIRGTIAGFQGKMMTVTSVSGPVRVLLTAKTPVVSVVPSDRAHIKDGSFLGIASQPRPDGSQRAMEVVVFPRSGGAARGKAATPGTCPVPAPIPR